MSWTQKHGISGWGLVFIELYVSGETLVSAEATYLNYISARLRMSGLRLSLSVSALTSSTVNGIVEMHTTTEFPGPQLMERSLPESLTWVL